MKIYVSADIEGVAGVVAPQQCQPGNPEYERGRRLMTDEVNAVIAGAFAGGASEVLVNDGHGPMLNILPDVLDPRAELILGKPKPANMAAGLTDAFAGMVCVGYHAGAGQQGVLSHTTNGFAFHAIRLNGHDCAEATLYGAYAGSLGVPVILLSGDDALVRQCGALFPDAQHVVVKRALGQRAACSLSPYNACERLRQASETAVRAAFDTAPLCIQGPYRLEIEMSSVALADLAAGIPVAKRTGSTVVVFQADTMVAVLGWVNTLSALSSFLR